MVFRDRKEAGEKLAEKLKKYTDDKYVVVLGLPRGGVMTAYEVAKRLKVPLDIVVSRKIGAPDNPELAIGAITENGQGVFDKDLIKVLNVTWEYIENEIAKEKEEADRRIRLYRGQKKPINLKNKIVILIDDGIATGSTMRAAIASIRAQKAAKIIVAVPMIASDTVNKVEKEADELVYLLKPIFFGAVGQFYENFEQTEDEEVIEKMQMEIL